MSQDNQNIEDPALSVRNSQALHQQGLTCLAQQRYSEALSAFQGAIALRPRWVAPHVGCADVSLAQGDLAMALAGYEQALALDSQDAQALTHRGNALLGLQRVAEAITSYERALQQWPEHAQILANLGGALGRAGRLEEALACCDQALHREPQLLLAQMNRGIALLDLGRLDEAQAAFATALAQAPQLADAHWRLAYCYLLRGDFARGWPHLEWRWQRSGYRGMRPPGPPWLGAPALHGRSILLYAEQGLGDTLMFARYVPMVLALGTRVVLAVQPALWPLMAQLAPHQLLSLDTQTWPACDFSCPLMSLPLALGTTLQNIPAPAAYLQADPSSITAWQQRLGTTQRLRVGLAWSGNPLNSHDATRSLPLALLLSAMPDQVQLISLQIDLTPTDQATLTAHPEVLHPGEAGRDLGEKAALIATLDLIITVDTAMAHLAAALGKPTWVLLSWMPDWRWLLERDDSPWYPSMRLFRQVQARQWDAPLAQLALALHDFAPSR